MPLTTRSQIVGISAGKKEQPLTLRESLPSGAASLENNWIWCWSLLQFPQTKKKVVYKTKATSIWYGNIFWEFCFCTAETRADVLLVEMESSQLPQSTSPKTRIWVSQARPCQEQPALFGSLERLAGQNAPGKASKASVQRHARTPRLRPAPRGTPPGSSPSLQSPERVVADAVLACPLQR